MKIKTSQLLLIITIVTFSFTSHSQTYVDSIPKAKEDASMIAKEKKLKFGVGFGLNFVGGTNISIAPNLTYPLSDKLAVGAGLQWNYLSIKDIQSTNTYGGNVLFLYSPIQKISTLLEFAELRVSTKSEIDDTTVKFWDSALFAGAAYNVTPKISIGAKYNFLYDGDESIYASPVIPFVNISF